MSENARPNVAIRIVRPYQTEDDFLTHELETVGKTSILIGAHPRPAGVILRFEVTLASGTTVLRGEGRVLAHKESAFRGQPGLSLRFTRLNPKSKAVVDRAAAMREARLSGDAGSHHPPAPTVPSLPPVEAAPEPSSVRSAPPPPAPAHEPVAVPVSFPAPADPALEAALTAPTPEPPRLPTGIEETPTPMALEVSLAATVPEPEPEPSTSVVVEPISEPAVAAAPTSEERAALARAPANRDEVLARLRQRASTLSRERVDAILAARPRTRER